MTAIQRMIEQIRTAIADCPASEKDVYEALVEESESWRMRLRELESEEEVP